MKSIFLNIAILLFFAQGKINELRIQQKASKYKQAQLFEVTKIDSVQKVYIIYATRNDSLIKIVSKKECGSECKSIAVNGKYDFKIKSLLAGLPGKRHIKGIKFNDTIVKLEGGSVVWDLFICENLKNLCLMSPN